MELKESRYNLYIKRKDGYFIYNTLSRALLYADDELVELIKRERFGLINREVLEELKDDNIVVDSEADEIRRVKALYWASRFQRDEIGVVILPTYQCNMACLYCYEGANKAPHIMSQKKARMVYQWLIEYLEGGGFKRLSVVFYGGEPLLNKEIIYLLSNELNQFCVEHSIIFNFHLVTNGLLLTPSIAAELVKSGLKSVQVTLDGPPEIHDRRRPLKNGKGTFDIVYGNVKEFLRNAPDKRLIIRVNVDKGNARYVDDLLRILERDGLRDKVVVDLGKVIITDYNLDYKNNLLGEEEVQKVSRAFLLKCIQRKIPTSLLNIVSGPQYCGAMHFHSWLIDPLGNLYKCWELLNEDFCMGSVDEGIRAPKHLEWMGIDPFESPMCRECIFLPCCGGGCVARSYFTHRDIYKRVCPWSKKEFIRTIESRATMLYKDKYKNG
jgi:uncharacterized protein